MKTRVDLQLVRANARAIAERSSFRTELQARRNRWNCEHIDTLIRALDTPNTNNLGFVVRLSSTGNPDFREYYGEGVLSPTITVEAPTLRLTQQIHDAYIAVFGLGAGNIGTTDVYLRDVKVAEISYNGRIWNQYPWGDPRRRELNPDTGEEITR